jgi:hypothetical protein
MSDFIDSDAIEGEEESPRGLRKQLEQELQAKREAENRAANAERELAFAKAGIDLQDQRMSYFVKGYDGDADPEKIRAAAVEAGFIGKPEPTVSDEELSQHQQVANLTAGAQTVDFDTNAEYASALAQARTKEDVLSLMDKFGSPRTSFV